MLVILAAVAALAQASPGPSAMPAPAVVTAVAPVPERMVLARRLFTAMGAEASLKVAADAMTRTLFDTLAARRDFEADWRAPAEAAAREAIDAATPEIMDRWAGLWARDLTEDDLRQAIAFYESPLARKIDHASTGHEAELQTLLADLAPLIDKDAAARFCQKTKACERAGGI